MPNALILGASGMTGQELCRQLLESKSFETITVLVRSPLDLEHPKLKQQLYDFELPEPSRLKGDVVFCCLGTTIKKAGSRDRFFRIDHDYVVESARFAHANGAKHFSLISAIGADPRSAIFYNRVKGQVEESLRQVGFSKLHIFRPSLLLGQRKEHRFGERISTRFMTLFSTLVPTKYKAVESRQVAKAMRLLSLEVAEGIRIIPNEEILQIDVKYDE